MSKYLTKNNTVYYNSGDDYIYYYLHNDDIYRRQVHYDSYLKVVFEYQYIFDHAEVLKENINSLEEANEYIKGIIDNRIFL